MALAGQCGSNEPAPYQSVTRRVHDPRRPLRGVARYDELKDRVVRLETDYASMTARVAAAEERMRILKALLKGGDTAE